jgi:hypothetical protein
LAYQVLGVPNIDEARRVVLMEVAPHNQLLAGVERIQICYPTVLGIQIDHRLEDLCGTVEGGEAE